MDNAVSAWANLLKVHAALVPELDRELQQRHQTPLTWYDVLLELNAAPERRLTMGELGQRVTVSRTRVSRVVDELSRAGLVTRESHPADKRSAYAVLTQAGRNRLRQAAPTYLAANAPGGGWLIRRGQGRGRGLGRDLVRGPGG